MACEIDKNTELVWQERFPDRSIFGGSLSHPRWQRTWNEEQ